MTKELKSFHPIYLQLQDKKASAFDIGAVILETAVKNRSENYVSYQSESPKDFRNKEEARVCRALLLFDGQNARSDSLESVLEYKRAHFGEYRRIVAVNFVFDAAQFNYINGQNLQETALFLGEKFAELFSPPKQECAGWKKRNLDLITDEYVSYISSLRIRLKNKFGVKFPE